MDSLRNVSVVWRLGIGFGLLLVLVAAVVIIGAKGSALQKEAMQQVVEVNMAKVGVLSDMLDANNEMMVVRRQMLLRQGDGLADDEARIAALVARYEASWKTYQAMPASDDEKAIAEAIATWRGRAQPLNKQMGELMRQGDFAAATALTLGAVQEAANGWNGALDNGVAYEETQSRDAGAAAIRLGEQTVMRLLILGAIALLVGIAASVLIGRSLTAPLARAVELAARMAKGDLAEEVRLGGRDEITRLGNAMGTVRETVRAAITAQLEMARQHEAGALGYRMDEAAFPGDFGRMIRATNELVG